MNHRMGLWFSLSLVFGLLWTGCAGGSEINDTETPEPQVATKIEVESSPTRGPSPEARQPSPTALPTLIPTPIEFPPAGAIVIKDVSPVPTPLLVPISAAPTATFTPTVPTKEVQDSPTYPPTNNTPKPEPTGPAPSTKTSPSPTNTPVPKVILTVATAAPPPAVVVASPAPPPAVVVASPAPPPAVATATPTATLQPSDKSTVSANPCDAVSDANKKDCQNRPCDYVAANLKKRCEEDTKNDPSLGPLQNTELVPEVKGSSNPCDGVSGNNKADCAKNPCNYVPASAKSACEQAFDTAKNDPNYGVADPNARETKTKAEQGYVESYDPNNIPKIAKYNFTELDQFSRMSKLRSAVGHDYSARTIEYDPSRANCKSMKHYFVPKGVPRQSALYATTPHTFQWKSIKFFAPADGTIQDLSYSQNAYGKEAAFSIGSTDHIGYYFIFFHIDLNPDLTNGSPVQAGQQIGTLGSEENWGEMAVQVRTGADEMHLISFLEVVTDDVLQQYKARGISNASDAIITKEQRDANPLACDSSEAGWFIGSGREGTPLDMGFVTWVFESGDNWFFFE